MSLSEMPRNLFSYQDHELLFDGVKLHSFEVVKHYQEPVILYRKELIRKRIQWVKSWSKVKQLHYAIKANNNSEILKLFKEEGCGLDVVSLGEIKAGLAAGFSMQDIIFSGVGKTKSELEFAIANQIYQINVESPAELRRISQISQHMNIEVNIGLRVNPLIETPTHPYISTALKDSKFGIDFSDVPECLKLFSENSLLKFKCISFHIGSQILEPLVFKEAVTKMKEYFLNLKKDFQTLDRFDVGGGLGIDYRHHDEREDEHRWNSLVGNYNEVLADFNFDILFELGRFMVARAGIFVTQVQYIKKQNMLVLDLGMNNNHRPSLYQAHHHFYNVHQRGTEKHQYALVGPICESSDIFHKSFSLFEAKEDDLLVMADCGAYVRSMASDYNLKGIAKEYFL